MLTAAAGFQNGMSVSTAATAYQAPPLKNVVIKTRWKIMETVGKGAFGEVYTALDLQTSETVAIKIESPACKNLCLNLRYRCCGNFKSLRMSAATLRQGGLRGRRIYLIRME
ncbi:hypothetical protein BC829DRAFT_112180 [Chytridium lagenaria]|nr:hypothetical protein BC829DRAFT_112180 [Chytridium lagenaria]